MIGTRNKYPSVKTTKKSSCRSFLASFKNTEASSGFGDVSLLRREGVLPLKDSWNTMGWDLPRLKGRTHRSGHTCPELSSVPKTLQRSHHPTAERTNKANLKTRRTPKSSCGKLGNQISSLRGRNNTLSALLSGSEASQGSYETRRKFYMWKTVIELQGVFIYFCKEAGKMWSIPSSSLVSMSLPIIVISIYTEPAA